MVRLTLTCQDVVREHAEPAALATAAAAAAAAAIAIAIASRPSRGVRWRAGAPARARRRKHGRKHRCHSACEQWARRRCLHG